MTVFARETAGSPRALWPGGRCPSGIPVRLPFRKRWCRKVDGFDFGTLWHPLMPGSGHRFLEDDNVRLLRPDSGGTSGSVGRCCLARPGPAPARPSAATTTHIRRSLDFPKKHQKNAGFTLAKPGKKCQKSARVYVGSAQVDCSSVPDPGTTTEALEDDSFPQLSPTHHRRAGDG